LVAGSNPAGGTDTEKCAKGEESPRERGKTMSVSSSENDRLVWIDCEMTGLDLAIDELVEIAIVITDYELRPLDPGYASHVWSARRDPVRSAAR
jgi:Exonuclease